MSPMKQQDIKANGKGHGPLHGNEMRWKRQTCPLKAMKIKSLTLSPIKSQKS